MPSGWSFFQRRIFSTSAWAANAIALNSGGFNLMKIIGPAAGGAMTALFGAAGNFYVQAVAYIGVLMMIYWMNVPPTSATARR
jgi:hypothetical protein